MVSRMVSDQEVTACTQGQCYEEAVHLAAISPEDPLLRFVTHLDSSEVWHEFKKRFLPEKLRLDETALTPAIMAVAYTNLRNEMKTQWNFLVQST